VFTLHLGQIHRKLIKYYGMTLEEFAESRRR